MFAVDGRRIIWIGAAVLGRCDAIQRRILRILGEAFLMPAALRPVGISLDAQSSPAHRKSPLVLVEMFALSGAGKSTVVEALRKQALVTTRKDLSAEWAKRSALQRLAHVGRAFGYYRRLTAAVRFGLGCRLNTREGLFRLVRLVAKTEWLGSRSGVVLLDQGFLQDLWSILLSSKSTCADPSLLAALICSLYEGIDATIVVLDVDPETASERVSARTHGHSRFDRLPEAQLRSSIDAASGLQDQIMESARLAGLQVIVVDGSPPPQVVADRLLALFPATHRKSTEQTPQRPRRISVVGATGSGKTVLARQIAERLNLPHHELDQLRHVVGGESSGQTFHSRIADLALSEEWIIDGHYREVRQLIWRRADVVVWLNYPLRLVASRLVKRYLRKRSASAPHADRLGEASGAARPIAEEGASWRRRIGRLIRTLRERSVYGRLLQSEHYANVKTVELRSIEATRQWLRDL